MKLYRKRQTNLSYTIELTQGEDADTIIEYFHTLYALVEKQHVVYTRLSLSKDPEAMELAEGIKMTSKMLGMRSDMNVFDFYGAMKNDIKQHLKLLGQDLDSPLDEDY